MNPVVHPRHSSAARQLFGNGNSGTTGRQVQYACVPDALSWARLCSTAARHTRPRAAAANTHTMTHMVRTCPHASHAHILHTCTQNAANVLTHVRVHGHSRHTLLWSRSRRASTSCTPRLPRHAPADQSAHPPVHLSTSASALVRTSTATPPTVPIHSTHAHSWQQLTAADRS